MDRDVGKTHLPNMTLRERDLRSKLARLMGRQGMLRGTLCVKSRSCGKSNCKCTQGEKHASLYIAFSQEGKTRQIYVSKDREQEVTQWVQQYQQAQELLEELSKVYLEKIQNRE